MTVTHKKKDKKKIWEKSDNKNPYLTIVSSTASVKENKNNNATTIRVEIFLRIEKKTSGYEGYDEPGMMIFY